VRPFWGPSVTLTHQQGWFTPKSICVFGRRVPGELFLRPLENIVSSPKFFVLMFRCRGWGAWPCIVLNQDKIPMMSLSFIIRSSSSSSP